MGTGFAAAFEYPSLYLLPADGLAREWLPTQALRNPHRNEDQVTERR